jgi:hypothetical protein
VNNTQFNLMLYLPFPSLHRIFHWNRRMKSEECLQRKEIFVVNEDIKAGEEEETREIQLTHTHKFSILLPPSLDHCLLLSQLAPRSNMINVE